MVTVDVATIALESRPMRSSPPSNVRPASLPSPFAFCKSMFIERMSPEEAAQFEAENNPQASPS
jgi:hypothetical protein